MQARLRMTLIRLLPLLLVVVTAGFWFGDVQQGGPYVLRNLLPPVIVSVLAAVTLWRGDGNWAGTGWRWPLGTAGFAIPALGLSLYLHYAYSVNLNGMFSNAEQPAQVFRFLPAYTLVAGAIGFLIGWIAGRNV
jgi:hypothetical protein